MNPEPVIHNGRVWTGRAGKATEVIIDKAGTVDETATLAVWFLHAPGQSAAWDKYLMSVIHLRHIDGGTREPVISAPHATHELLVAALDPSMEPVAEQARWACLTPLNVMEQFEVPTDADAVRLLELSVRAVLAGWLWVEPPLSGQVEPWRSTVVRTSAHLRGEVHAR